MVVMIQRFVIIVVNRMRMGNYHTVGVKVGMFVLYIRMCNIEIRRKYGQNKKSTMLTNVHHVLKNLQAKLIDFI